MVGDDDGLTGSPAADVHGQARSGLGAMDWRFVVRGLATALVVACFALSAIAPLRYYLIDHADHLWVDAHIYFRATHAWATGGDPWAASFLGIPFAAPPPALLLNLPILPFGESFAPFFWVAANTLALGILFRRLRLPAYWLLFQPILEAWLGASPDLLLAALALVGAGALAVAFKPYSIPGLLAEQRWRAVLLGLVLASVTLPVLPWGPFLDGGREIQAAFDSWGRPLSAFGDPVLMVVVAIALLSLGARRGLALAVPGLFAMQPHYLLFSMPTIARSMVLAATLTFSFPRATAYGVLAYAIIEHVKEPLRRALVRAWRRIR